MKVAYVEYTGDGQDNHAITGAGFAPDMALCITSVQYPIWRTDDMGADESIYLGYGLVLTTGIKTLTADGCTLGTSGYVNTNGVTYSMLFFKDDGVGDFALGTYTGDGNDDRDIACATCTTPALVWLNGIGSTAPCLFRDSQCVGDNTHDFGNAIDQANRIQSYGASEFQVGLGANTDTKVYYFAVFAASAIYEDNAYTGNGIDDRDIATAIDADLVVVKAATKAVGQQTPFRTPLRGATTTISFFANIKTATADVIQAMDADSFQIGTHSSVNTDEGEYHWFAFAAGETGAAGGGGPIIGSSIIGSIIVSRGGF